MHWRDKLTEKIEETFYYVDMWFDEPDIYIKPQWKWLEKLLEFIKS